MIRKVLSSSLLLSLLVAFPLSAIETSQDVKILSFSDLDKVDMSEATLAFSPELVSTNGIEEDISLLYDKDGFYVRTKENDVRVKAYDTDKFLRGRKANDIAKFSQIGKFKVSKFDNGEYAVHVQGGLKGGGPILAVCAAVGVRIVGYSAAGVLFFIPGCQALVVPTCQVTEITANYATGFAAAAPTP
jgi:hypothetical protein